MGDPERDILDLIQAGEKIRAIKLAREVLGLSLVEAKDLVDGLAPGAPAKPPNDAQLQSQIDDLLRARRKIDAVKLYRTRASCGLKEAKDAIELRAVELGLQTRPSKCFIATAAWGGGEQAEVMALRRFRNRVLRKSRAGRVVIGVYERVSPPLAWVVERSAGLAWCVRVVVAALARAPCLRAFHRRGL